MKKLLILLLSLPIFLSAQQRVLGPYLQDADTTSIVIMWETTFGTPSKVSYGLTPNLGNETTGSSATGFLFTKIHNVRIEDLQPDTKYYYSVSFGSAYSDTIQFKTAPLPSSEKSFGMIAFSDMQKDASNASKFKEIVEEGVLDYSEGLDGLDVPDKLAYILVPGDLVDIGWIYPSWKDEFFEPAQKLFEMVPVYPVLGNHEANTAFFFSYFDLPENGYDGFKEHWWYKDYSNTRIIGLDTNIGFISANGGKQKQLTWLQGVLDDACANGDIDFVFVQLHHPFHSEMWLPGEEPYTGDVIPMLENFSTSCDKPSIHFYGHTHGYARGQSKDHKHLMVNVASAGGALDKWDGDDRDYEEYSKGFQEYGFVYLEVEAGDEPKFTLKRITRGSPGNIKDNEIQDSIVIYKNNDKPTQPIGIRPIDVDVSTECIILEANLFNSDEEGTLHGETQWQVAADCNSFDNPIADVWKNYENWYFNENIQANDDLTDQEITGLSGNTDYCWRVRYRDRNLRWSDWSEPLSFTTKQPVNLLENPGAELGIQDWVVTQGAIESLATGECDGNSPFKGSKYFVVGAACQYFANAKAHQTVDVSAYTDIIDEGNKMVYFGGYLSNYNGLDKPEFRLTFLDDGDNSVGQTQKYSHQQPNWKAFDKEAVIPASTRKIKFELFGTRGILGSANDSYFDELYLVVDSFQGTIDTVICEGESITIFGTELSEAGTYTVTDEESEDCLNQYEVIVTVIESTNEIVAEAICFGDSILFGDNYYSIAGNYNESFMGANGCDSSVNLQLEILPLDASQCVTGLLNQTTKELAVYPNPFKNQTTISLGDLTANNLTFKVYNNLGEVLVVKENINSSELVFTRDNLSNGVYHFVFEKNQNILGGGSFVIEE